jgi:hypothetical protein
VLALVGTTSAADLRALHSHELSARLLLSEQQRSDVTELGELCRNELFERERREATSQKQSIDANTMRWTTQLQSVEADRTSGTAVLPSLRSATEELEDAAARATQQYQHGGAEHSAFITAMTSTSPSVPFDDDDIVVTPEMELDELRCSFQSLCAECDSRPPAETNGLDALGRQIVSLSSEIADVLQQVSACSNNETVDVLRRLEAELQRVQGEIDAVVSSQQVQQEAVDDVVTAHADVRAHREGFLLRQRTLQEELLRLRDRRMSLEDNDADGPSHEDLAAVDAAVREARRVVSERRPVPVDATHAAAKLPSHGSWLEFATWRQMLNL